MTKPALIDVKPYTPENAVKLIDDVVAHVIRQGRRSVTVNVDFEEKCLYRGPDGLQCAIGACISDDDYRAEWDNSGLGALSVALRLPPSNPLRTYCTLYVFGECFLTPLQKLHDNEGNWAYSDGIIIGLSPRGRAEVRLLKEAVLKEAITQAAGKQ